MCGKVGAGERGGGTAEGDVRTGDWLLGTGLVVEGQ